MALEPPGDVLVASTKEDGAKPVELETTVSQYNDWQLDEETWTQVAWQVNQ